MNVAAGALQYQEPGKVPSVVLALVVHVLLAVFLFFGVNWQSKQPEAVEVELWVSPPVTVAARVEPKPQIKPEPIPVPKPEMKPVPQVEAPKPDIALEKKKELKKEPPKKEPPKLEPPKKELPKKEPPKKELPTKVPPKLNFDLSKDNSAQADREVAELNKQQEPNRILEAMKREGAASAASADAAYIGKLKGKIRSNVVLPPDIPGNPEAIFDVVQLPTGEVLSVKLRKSSGHTVYDDAVERAINKSSPLPRPDRPEQFQRSLEIKFRPLELK
jgi:colicin import membrane protein